MKVCTKCRAKKHVEDFGKDRNTPDGLKYNCRECKKLENMAYREAFTEEDKERKKASKKRRYHANLNKSRISATIDNFKKFGVIVTAAQVSELRDKAVCEICGRIGEVQIDHCYVSKKVRGVLCGKCNRALGFFEDKIDSLKAAIEYLKESHGP